MPKRSAVRALTGNRRRRPLRNTSQNRRTTGLSHEQVGFMMRLHQRMTVHLFRLVMSIFPLYAMIGAHAFVSTNPQLFPQDQHVQARFAGITCAGIANVMFHFSQYWTCYRLDYLLHDISPEEEEDLVAFKPSKNVRFSTWTDQDCYEETGFNKHKLKRIYRCFRLEQIANNNGGMIRVNNGPNNPKCYSFHPEEMFLYFMARMRQGKSHTKMCYHIFGGSPKRWSPAWRWILLYLDHRYRNIIGHQGLIRFIDDFPLFYDAISQKVKRDEIKHNNDGSSVLLPGLNFLPFDIFGFIDCSIDRICRPFSGPAGDYIGAPRKEDYSRTQRAFYTGYKKCHGIKVETVLLPNGISTVFGPVSARPHDVTGVLTMSGLNRFLVEIQRNRQHQYQVMGDGVYGGGFMECVRSYFRPPLTQEQSYCNKKLKACRQSIEWSYGDISVLFEICDDPKHYMLGKKNPYAIEQLRVCHLLVNIHNCLNGGKAAGHNVFCCSPPTLEEYLRVN